MKLHSPAFERSLRRGVRRAARATPALKREYKTANKFHRHYSASGLVRVIFAICLALPIWSAVEKTAHPTTAAAVITLWCLAFVFVRAHALLQCLYTSNDLPAISLLPIDGLAVFRWQFQKFLRGSLFLLVDLLIGFWVLAAATKRSDLVWAMLPLLAFLTWCAVLACALFCASRRPTFPLLPISWAVMLLPLGIYFAQPVALPILDHLAPTLNVLLPVGWPVSLFHCFPPENHWLTLLLLLPTFGLIWTVKGSLVRLQGSYEFSEYVEHEPPDIVPSSETPAQTAPAANPDKPFRAGLTEIEHIIESRQFLQSPLETHHTAVERWLWLRLTPREKILAEFVFPAGLAVTAPWRKIFRNLLIAFCALLLIRFIGFPLENWILGIGLFVTCSQMLVRIFGGAAAFSKVLSSGVQIPMYAGFPVGYRELGRLLLKYTAAQTPFVFLFTAVAGAFAAWIEDFPIFTGTEIGCKIAVLFFGARFIQIALAFSSGTNDSTVFRLGRMVRLLLMVASGGLFLLLCFGGILVPSSIGSWGICVLAILEAYGFFRLYGWFYHSNCFDLMALPRK
jgi:hypothetical protein